MASTPKQIMNYAASLPEGALLHPKGLLHLGSRARAAGEAPAEGPA